MLLNVNSIYTKLLGIFVLLGFVYYRFIYERLPRSLIFLYKENSIVNLDYLLLFIIIISLSISSIICIVNYRIILKKPLKVKNYFFIKYLINFSLIIKEALFSVYKHIADNLENGYDKLRKICMYSYKVFAYKEKYIVITDCIFLQIICISFIYDILNKFTLYYFYKTLMLLGVSLLIKLWIHLIEDWVSNITVVTENLNVTHKFLPDGRDHFHFEVKPGFTPEEAALILEHDKKEFLRMVPLKGFLESYYSYETYYKPRTLFMIYLIYSIGWLFIIYKNIILYYVI